MSISPDVPVSWNRTDDPTQALGALQASLELSAAMLGVFSIRQPEPEGVLAAVGVDADRLEAWCRDAGDGGPNWRHTPVGGEQVFTASLPASLDGSRCWYLACGRDRALSSAEELVVRQALRHRQVAMDYVSEPGMGRVLVGRDNRLLHADPDTELALRLAEGSLGAWMDVIRPTAAQRWGEMLESERVYDAILPLPGPRGATWVRLRHSVPVAGLAGAWHLELRPVDPDDPPAVGVLADERLAAGLAYLMGRYRLQPNLEETADAAHISPFHFHRLFTRTIGVSPKHYLLRMQIMIAKWRLRATPRAIQDIASQAGFASHGHFTATFHRMVGVSPKTYREQEGPLGR